MGRAVRSGWKGVRHDPVRHGRDRHGLGRALIDRPDRRCAAVRRLPLRPGTGRLCGAALDGVLNQAGKRRGRLFRSRRRKGRRLADRQRNSDGGSLGHGAFQRTSAACLRGTTGWPPPMQAEGHRARKNLRYVSKACRTEPGRWRSLRRQPVRAPGSFCRGGRRCRPRPAADAARFAVLHGPSICGKAEAGSGSRGGCGLQRRC